MIQNKGQAVSTPVKLAQEDLYFLVIAEVKTLLPLDALDLEDREVAGIYTFFMTCKSPTDAIEATKDIFHASVPIAVLDDFEITFTLLHQPDVIVGLLHEQSSTSEAPNHDWDKILMISGLKMIEAEIRRTLSTCAHKENAVFLDRIEVHPGLYTDEKIFPYPGSYDDLLDRLQQLIESNSNGIEDFQLEIFDQVPPGPDTTDQ